jgi:ABC-type amino acid transport substrate-binding protein
MRLRGFAVQLLILCLGPTGFAADKTVSLATLEWEPYVGKKLTDHGFTAEIVTEAFRRAGCAVTIDFMPWARVLQELSKGKYDAAFPAYYSDKRAKTYALSNPIAEGPLVFCKKKEADISYTSLHDLKPYRIGVVRGYVNTPQFDAADYLAKDVANSDEINLKKLLKGRIDLAVIDKFTAKHILSTTMPEGRKAVEFLEPSLQVKPLYLAVSRKTKGWQQLVKEFNQGLKQITEDGTLRKIMRKHGFD